MKKNLCILFISCIIVGIVASCKAPSDYTNIPISCLSVIMSDGSEYALVDSTRTMTSFNVLRADSLKIVAVVMSLGTDSVQILYSSSAYNDGYETRITSLNNYRNYEAHRIKAFLNAPK